MVLNSSPATAARNISLLLRNTPRHITAQFTRHHSSSTSSVSSDELKHFASLASSWWDPQGPSRILHLMNPVRHDFIASCLAASQPPRRPPTARNSTTAAATTDNAASAPNRETSGLKYLDVGCGGGIFAESLARTIPDTDNPSSSRTRASSLLAIDPSKTMIDLARSHARKDPALYAHLQTGKFEYANTSLEDLTANVSESESEAEATTSRFDIVTIFEVLEHVDPQSSSPRSFLEQCLRLVRPGGWLVGSTIARTWASYVVNQVVAEAPWPVGVVPPGTHEWSKFVNAEEVKGWAEEVLRNKQQGGEVSKAYPGTGWKCVGAVYVPGLGWKLVPGAETWGNYFWGIQKME